MIAYVKIHENEDILSSMSNLQPNWCLKIDYQKVDQHAGGINDHIDLSAAFYLSDKIL